MAKDTRPANNRAAERPRCPKCGFRIRGKNHADGQHCTEGRGGRYKPKSY